jgi:very-short-patch-repair endonuclease
LPVEGSSSSSSFVAAARSSARLDSTSVIARASALRSPDTSVCAVLSSEFRNSAPSERSGDGTVTTPIHSRSMANRWFDELLLELAVAQHGAFSARQALDRGGTRALLAARCRAGRITRVRVGLYVHNGFPPSWRQDLWLEHLATPDLSAVCGEPAAALHGLGRFGRQTVEVLTRWGSNHAPVRGRVHETFWLPESHVVKIDGLPVTSLPRTVFDLAGMPRHPLAFRHEGARAVHIARITRLLNTCIRDKGMTMTDVVRVLAALGRRGKPGTSIMREIVADLGADYEPTDSELEDLFLEVVRAARLEEPDRQVRIGNAQRFIGRVDFRWMNKRVVVEVDGPQHRAPLDRRADRERDRALEAQGWHVIRIPWWELVYEPEKVVARLRAALVEAVA